MRLAALLFATVALPASALDFCPSVGKVDVPANRSDPCEGLAFLAKIASKCAAEMPEDRNLQRHAAGILELERQVGIDSSVLASMRQMGSFSQERIAFQESYAAKNRDALAEKRALAVSAGYSQLASEGPAQAVITNAVWRYLDNAIQPHVAGCTQAGGDGLLEDWTPAHVAGLNHHRGGCDFLIAIQAWQEAGRENQRLYIARGYLDHLDFLVAPAGDLNGHTVAQKNSCARWSSP